MCHICCIWKGMISFEVTQDSLDYHSLSPKSGLNLIQSYSRNLDKMATILIFYVWILIFWGDWAFSLNYYSLLCPLLRQFTPFVSFCNVESTFVWRLYYFINDVHPQWSQFECRGYLALYKDPNLEDLFHFKGSIS